MDTVQRWMVVELLPFHIRDWKVMCHNSSSPLCSSFILLPTKPAFLKKQLLVSIEPLCQVFSSSEANIRFNRRLFYFSMKETLKQNNNYSTQSSLTDSMMRSPRILDKLATGLSISNTSCFSCLSDNQSLADFFAWYPD